MSGGPPASAAGAQMSGPPSGAPSAAGAEISKESLTVFLIIALVIGTTFVLLRTGARWLSIRKIPVDAEDLAIYVALVAFAAQTGLYFAIIPTLYELVGLATGQAGPPGPDFHANLVSMVKELTAQFNIFWLVLWSVKLSLLCMFKKLATGLPVYLRLWWGILVFVILTYIGAVISNVVVFPYLFEWYTSGQAPVLSHRAQVGTAASLWYTLAVDLLTDLLIMAIPLVLLYNLHINLKQKLGLIVIFTVGIITMCFAIVRAVYLNGAQSAGPSSTEWLIFWSAMESMVAIIVGCLPSFAIFVRTKVAAATRRTQDDSQRTVTSSSKIHNLRPSQISAERAKSKLRGKSLLLDDVELEDGISPTDFTQGRSRHEKSDSHFTEVESQQDW